MKKRVLCLLLVLVMLLSLVPTSVFAAQADPADMSAEEYALWKQNLTASDSVSLMSAEDRYIRNEYIEAYINEEGHYTIGTTGGNPESSTDDNKKLLYGHPDSSTTETLIRIDEVDHFFRSSDSTFSADGTKCTSTMTIDGVVIKQTISLQHNTYTQRADVAEIRYDITNNSGSSKRIGGRIMLDTMLGDNDGAPFKIPGVGDVVKECEFVGNAIPQYWQSFDNLENPTVVSSGTFYKSFIQRPNKVQFAYWGGIVGSSWDFKVDTDQSLTGDSAVAAYYDPTTVQNGATKTFCTYYGLSDLGEVENVGEVTFRLSGAVAALVPNETGTAYTDNPFTLTAYIQNSTASEKTVTVTLNVPSELEAGNLTKTITLPANAERNVSWEIWAKPQSVQKTVNYSVTVAVDDQQKTENLSVRLPAVSYYDVQGLRLNKTSLSIQKGQSERLIAYLVTPDGETEAKKYEVRWSSSNPSVATVDANGNITALKVGTTTIRAITADYKATKTCSVNVVARPTKDLDLWGLSKLVYKNLDNYKNKRLDQIFKKNANGTVKGLYGDNERFYEGTMTVNSYFLSEMGAFTVIDTYKNTNHDFYAAAFKAVDDSIIISYRGSDTLFGRDGIEDLAFAIGDTLGPQFYMAWYFFNQVEAAYPNSKILLTGHSLGGALAAFVSIVKDREAVTFNGAEGLIIDLAYYANAYYIDSFRGIDNWRFRNHYNEKDYFVGGQNPDLYDSLAHPDNGQGEYGFGFAPHDIDTLVEVKENGKLALTRNWRKASYYLYQDEWTREVLAQSKGNVYALNLVGLNPDYIKKNSGRVMLGTENSYMKDLTAPRNLVEIRDNVFFSAGNTTMTGHGGSPDTFVFKNGDKMYGKGDDDTYITYENWGASAHIIDPSGKDKIIFKNMAMSSLSLGSGNDTFYRINTGGGHQVWVEKQRNLFQPEIIIVDKYGAEKKITELNGSRSVDLMAEEPAQVTTMLLEGNGLSVDVLDAAKNVLGTYTAATSQVFADDHAYVYTTAAADGESIEIELLRPDLFARVTGGEQVKLSVKYGDLAETDSAFYTAELDLTSNAAALISGNGDAAEKFVYVNGAAQTPVNAEQYEKVSAIVPVLDAAPVDRIELYAGESVTLDLTFQPEKVAVDDVSLELLAESDTVALKAEDDRITIRGSKAGTDTLKITALDGSGATVSIPITVKQDAMDRISLTTNGEAYTAGTWSNYPVEITAAAPAGYDTIVCEVNGTICQLVDSVTISTEGQSVLKIYGVDTATGKITAANTYDLLIDLEAPSIEGVEDGATYYIDRLVDSIDRNLSAVTVNGTEFTEDEYAAGKWISTPGTYTVVSEDRSGKCTEITFTLCELPAADALTLADADLVEEIRMSFEDVKHLMTAERSEQLEAAIYELERRISYLSDPQQSGNSILAFSIEGQIGEAVIDEAQSAIELEVTAEALAAPQTAFVALSDGATISPAPHEAQDFSSAVVYTVTAANGTARQWTVTARLTQDHAAPQIVSSTMDGNTIVLEFDENIGQILNAEGFRLTGGSSENPIQGVSCLDNMVTITFEDVFGTGTYTLHVDAGSLTSVFGVGNQSVTATFYMGVAEKAATPVADQSGLVLAGTAVTLTTATEGATIYYTLDGTEPTTASAVYTCPVVINYALTLKAIAVKDGMDPSDVLTVSFTIRATSGSGTGRTARTSAPQASIQGGVVAKGTSVTLNSTVPGAKIYYTLDGSTPTTRSTLYTGPIVLMESTTLKFIAVSGSLRESAVVTLNFTIKTANVTMKKNAADLPYMAPRGDKFCPDASATRYEVIEALAELFDIEKMAVSMQFSDVESAKAELVSLLVGAGVINGYPDGTFGGEKSITRAEFVKILSLMLGINANSDAESTMTDIAGHWAKSYIVSFVAQGYLQGYPDGTFRPDRSITRAEVVTIINRIVGAANKTTAVSADVAEKHWAYDEIQKALLIK